MYHTTLTLYSIYCHPSLSTHHLASYLWSFNFFLLYTFLFSSPLLPQRTMQNLLLSQPTYALLPPPLSAVLLLLAGLLLSAALLFGLSLQWSGHRAPLSGKREQGRRRLPPGSMGWPYLGETLKFYTENPNSFFSNRLKRYTYVYVFCFDHYIRSCMHYII